MKLSEMYRQLYHGSWQPLQVGNVYRARAWNSKRAGMGYHIEKIFEYYRPSNALSRQRVFFLVDDPGYVSMAGGEEEYVYQVQSIGRISRHDQEWLGEIGNYIASDTMDGKRIRPNKTYEKLATQYWSGNPYSDTVESLWEYLTPSFRVIKLESSRDR